MLQGMYEDLERIVESRARSLDVLSSSFYNFLYSFHVKKGNLRKAASVMYEQGMRLSQETNCGPESLQRQAKCYLACLNTMRLVDPKYAWIVKPVPHIDIDREVSLHITIMDKELDTKLAGFT